MNTITRFGFPARFLTAAVVAVALVAGGAVGAGDGEEEEGGMTAYVCPPCGMSCDEAVHDAPGRCPASGHPLRDAGPNHLAR